MESFPQQGPRVEDTSTRVLNGLKNNAMEIASLAIAGQSTSEIRMRPNTWSEHDGVIMFADESGKLFATPASEEKRKELFDNAIEKDEGVGVPALNNQENWSNPNGSSFTKWKNLAEWQLARERNKERMGEEAPQ